MSAKLNNVILEAVKLRKRLKTNRNITFQAVAKLVKAIDAANLLPGEPIFCLRGKDRCAPRTLRYWLFAAENDGAVPNTLNEVRRKLQSFEGWQNDMKNMRHVKVPT